MDNKQKHILDKVSSFSLLLIMIVLIIIGLGLSPLIDVGSKPRPQQGKNITIRYWWKNASPKVVEQEVTSKIEGIVSMVKGIKDIYSESRVGYGSVNLVLKKGVNVSAVRFEISSLLKQIKNKLPEKVTYPQLTGGDITRSDGLKPTSINLLTYRINSDMDGKQIKEYIENKVSPIIRKFEGVQNISVTGGTSRYMEISYNPMILSRYGLTANMLADGINKFIGKSNIIGDIDNISENGEKSRITLYLSSTKFSKKIGEMPLTKVNDKIIYLNDLATYKYKNHLPGEYYRVNGLNTIYLNIKVDADANQIALSETLRKEINKLKSNLRKDVYFTLTHDASEELQTELNKLMQRTVLSLIILLIFVFIINRSWKYLLIIFVTLVANITIAIICYYIFDIRLHIFSLAGIAVSFGIIIDASIVMVDHYSYYKNRKVFIAILAALITTIGALIILFFMPEYIQKNLYDFSRIIIINLSVALIVALIFVPAIIDKINYSKKGDIYLSNRYKKIIRWSKFYKAYISFTQKHKWIYYILLVLAFGLPISALPAKIGGKKVNYYTTDRTNIEWYEKLYNETLGTTYFISKIKPVLNNILGGSMSLFSSSLKSNTYNRNDKKEIKLHITGKMPLGGSMHDLNEKVRILEKFIVTFKEIKRLETYINYSKASITVEFKDEYEKESFPFYFEKEVIGKLLSIGGADWSTYGVSERGFSNSLNLSHRSQRIEIAGYNFNQLVKYANELANKIKKQKRARDVIVHSGRFQYGRNIGEDELYMDFNKYKVALYNLNLFEEYNALSELLSFKRLGYYSSKLINTELYLKSLQQDKFDVWNLNNAYLNIKNRDLLISSFGKIKKRKSKNYISKQNQEYNMTIAYNYLGSYQLSHNFNKKMVKDFNEKVPVGYHCINRSFGFYEDDGSQYWLILLIVVIIFFICAILFESLWQPFVIITLIPVSFIGTFLTFYFTEINFGTGGFASLVLLCGIVVNAGIYIINEYNNNISKFKTSNKSKLNIFIKSYNHKIIPVFLTIISTVLGLIPFFFDTEKTDFWYSFAVGTCGGLLFSIFALVFVMPIFMPLKKNKYLN